MNKKKEKCAEHRNSVSFFQWKLIKELCAGYVFSFLFFIISQKEKAIKKQTSSSAAATKHKKQLIYWKKLLINQTFS